MARYSPLLGFLNINKPSGMTAHDVVSLIRKMFSIKQVGHAGTLDPQATGVLPVALGKACRLLRYLDSGKIYLAEILLGTGTDSDDVTGKIISQSASLPEIERIQAAARAFSGEIMQIPPAYSAVHHQGKRLYSLARQGKLPENIAARQVRIDSFEIVKIALPVVQARIACGKGTYMRSIARDLGKMLGCGGCLQSLVREQCGPFALKDAITLDQLEQLAKKGQARQALVLPANVLPLPAISLNVGQKRSLTLGQCLSLETDGDISLNDPSDNLKQDSGCPVIVTCEGELIAVCRKTPDNKLKPEVVLTNAN